LGNIGPEVSHESLIRESSKPSSQKISVENITQTVVISTHAEDSSGSFSQFSRNNLEALRENDSLTGGKKRENPREERE